jgi:predicted metal-binding protein
MNLTEQFETYLSSTVNQGVDHTLLVETSKIFTASRVRIKCTFGCPAYGKSLCFPPHPPSPDEMRKALDSCAYAMGSGQRSRCETCDTGGLCVNPQKARPSMEACGIDVFGTVRKCGLPIHVVKNHSEERDMHCLVLIK